MKNIKKYHREKLTISECKAILSKNGKVYSENEIISIMDLLYGFAQIDIDTFRSLEERENEFNNAKIKTYNDEINNQINQNDNFGKAA